MKYYNRLLIFYSVIAINGGPVFGNTPPILYISPTGSDNNSGLTPQDPVLTSNKISEIAGSGSSLVEVKIMPGKFLLASPFIIKARAPMKWSALQPGTVLFDGGGKIDTGIFIRSSDVTISGVSICCTQRDGFKIEGAHDVSIINNKIYSISGTGGSQGAIHGLQVAYNITISGNIINDIGYAGVMFEASDAGNISNVVVSENSIKNTCQRFKDCGAVYSIGHTRLSYGFRIINNDINGFGPASNFTKGIYLDDGLSGAVVDGNNISGNGTFAIEVHGGNKNKFTHNIFSVDVSNIALLQNVQVYMTDMTDNNFTDNIIDRGSKNDSFIFRRIGVSKQIGNWK